MIKDNCFHCGKNHNECIVYISWDSLMDFISICPNCQKYVPYYGNEFTPFIINMI